jgi:hypothetical protein
MRVCFVSIRIATDTALIALSETLPQGVGGDRLVPDGPYEAAFFSALLGFQGSFHFIAWFFDSGASTHVTGNRAVLTDVRLVP